MSRRRFRWVGSAALGLAVVVLASAAGPSAAQPAAKQPWPPKDFVPEPITPPLSDKHVYDVPEGLTTPDHLRFDLPFQNGPYCGPNALFLLLRLYHVDVKYEDVL